MKIILVNPPAPEVREAHDLPDYPHSGIGYLAAYLEKKGEACEVLDAKLERLTKENTVKRIAAGGFDCVGISAMTHDITNASGLARALKSVNPGITTIIGGVHATALPGDTLSEFPAFDYLIHGEGEVTLYDLVQCLKQGGSGIGRVEGTAYRDGGNVAVNPRRPRIENLDELPFPDISRFPRCREYHIITARGCPFRCVFCMSPYGRGKIRERSPANVIEELERIAVCNPRLVKFNDETFGFHRDRAYDLLDSIVEHGLHGIKKVASLRVDNVDAPFLRKMKEAGFSYIDYGIESGNQDVLKRIKKGITMEQAEKAVRMTKEAGIRVGANYIIGHPGETPETARQTIEFAVKLNADANAIGLMVPYPGTEVAEMARKGEGGYRLLSLDWSDYNKQIGNALELETLSRKQMERLQLSGYLKILIKNFRFLGLIGFVWGNRKSGAAFVKSYLKNRRN